MPIGAAECALRYSAERRCHLTSAGPQAYQNPTTHGFSGSAHLSIPRMRYIDEGRKQVELGCVELTDGKMRPSDR